MKYLNLDRNIKAQLGMLERRLGAAPKAMGAQTVGGRSSEVGRRNER